MTLPSYCSQCDAPPGHCNHHAARYHDPIVYDTVTDNKGRTIGYKPPDGPERERFDNPPNLTKPTPPADTPKPLPQIVAELDDWLVIDQRLERTLRAKHADNPRVLTRLADKLITDIRAGNVTNPEGMLTHRLKQLPDREGAAA